ncbi:putative UspA domain-containing protein [Roseivivax marinus]|jgi:nucleotide-binding universal stress UspA family protein|uniref:Putative UspA domain-containing protein n=1 Tax=Roseivivax marinus TaxID=1379903 RepID=W4HFH9_9RHOB|nr:universal stress protein [Roseivivax marinus]ETW11158.1 putative UspA domain-containing protein [Roseivivax marinus]UMA65474.1 universal stress protein [Roseivivax marinus]SEL77864.1 Nucleotide-binding universal stress protein, UspA family [Roseivivax marinus]
MYKKILIPIAPDHIEALEDSIAPARALADEGAEIHALCVVETIPLYVAAEVPATVYEKASHEMEQQLEQAFAEMPDVKVRAVNGSPASKIVEIAGDEGFDLVVVRSHKPGIQDWFLGSTAGRVVRHAPCAIHVVR